MCNQLNMINQEFTPKRNTLYADHVFASLIAVVIGRTVKFYPRFLEMHPNWCYKLDCDPHSHSCVGTQQSSSSSSPPEEAKKVVDAALLLLLQNSVKGRGKHKADESRPK